MLDDGWGMIGLCIYVQRVTIWLPEWPVFTGWKVKSDIEEVSLLKEG